MAEKIISPGVFQVENDQSLVQKGIQQIGAVLIGPTVKGRPLIPTSVTSYSEYESIFGSILKSGSYYYEYFTSLTAKEYFQSGGKTLLVTRIISGSANVGVYASSYIPISGSNVNASVSSSFELESVAWGDISNNLSTGVSGALASGSRDNVRWEVSNVDYNRGTFTILIRRGDDNQNQKNILESWANVCLDPMQPNFISRVIGDKKPVYVASVGTEPAYLQYTGSYNVASRYIRVKSINTVHADSIDNNGLFKSALYSSSLPNIGSGSIEGAFSGGVAATGLTQLFNENITNTNIQGFTTDDYINAINLLSNRDEYLFNVILSPGVTLTSAAGDDLVSLAENRGDSIAIVDTQLFGGTITAATQAALSNNSNYAATYWPWIQVFSSNLGKIVWAPASVVMGGVLAFNDQVSAAWFAPAGINRGGIPSVIQAERKLSGPDRDTLYQSNVNPLATFPREGVVVYGQKTLQKRSTALDRVNVRRLLIALKDYIGQVSRGLVFEQNTNVTRNRFLSLVNPFLESVVQKQGLYAYKVVMDDTNNTADVIDRNQLVGAIYIQPTKTVEFIILNFNITPTGAQFPTS